MYRPLKSTTPSQIQAVNEAVYTKPSKVETVKTSYGDVQATVYGDLTKDVPPIVTYHAMGINHVACFQRFFNMAKHDHVIRHFPVIHIDAPGHTYGAPNLPSSIEAFDSEVLAQGVEDVVKKFSLEKIIPFGVGLGATVMMLYAKRNPGMCRGLILVCPQADSACWTDKLSAMTERASEWAFGSGMRQWLYTRFFPNRVPGTVKEYFKSELTAINLTNALKWYRGYLNRTDKLKDVKEVTTKAIVFIGERWPYASEGLRVQSNLKPDRTDYILVDENGVLMTETAPDKLLGPLELFFNALGFYDERLEKRFAAKSKTLLEKEVSSG